MFVQFVLVFVLGGLLGSVLTIYAGYRIEMQNNAVFVDPEQEQIRVNIAAERIALALLEEERKVATS